MKNINFGRQTAVLNKKQSQFSNKDTGQEHFRNKGQPPAVLSADKKMQGKFIKN